MALLISDALPVDVPEADVARVAAVQSPAPASAANQMTRARYPVFSSPCSWIGLFRDDRAFLLLVCRGQSPALALLPGFH